MAASVEPARSAIQRRLSIAASWTAESYDLWTKNCNNFSDVVLNFLCGRGVPAWILSLPGEMLATPLGKLLGPILGNVQDALNGSLEKNGGLVGPKGETMTLTVKAASGSAAPDAAEQRQAPRRRSSTLPRPRGLSERVAARRGTSSVGPGTRGCIV